MPKNNQLIINCQLSVVKYFCGAEGIRTPGLDSAIVALSQLSYSPAPAKVKYTHKLAFVKITACVIESLSTNLAHRAIFGKDPVFELVANGLGTNGAFEEIDQILMRAALAQRISKIDLLIRQQAQPYPAIGGETQAVAAVAIRIADRANKADRAFSAG